MAIISEIRILRRRMRSKELDSACAKALEQIRTRRYDQALREDGRNEILAYGIAFWKKRCRVVVEKRC